RPGARCGRGGLCPDHGLRGGAADAAAHQGAQPRDRGAGCPRRNDDADPPRLGQEELRALARHCLDRGVRAVCVTLDEHGCVAFHRDGSGRIAEEFVDRIKVEHVVDTTGAGDSFAGGLAYGYLAYRNYVVACQYGNAMGAQRCTGTELGVYLPREETERQIRAAYGPPGQEELG